MPIGNGGGIISRPGEYTRTSEETEVKIPWQTFIRLGIVGNLSILSIILAIWCVRLHVYLRDNRSVWRWLEHEWWPVFRVWWPINLALLVLWWGVVASAPTVFRFGMEQLLKNAPPHYLPHNPENGAWWPWHNWRRRRIERFGLNRTYQKRFEKGDQ